MPSELLISIILNLTFRCHFSPKTYFYLSISNSEICHCIQFQFELPENPVDLTLMVINGEFEISSDGAISFLTTRTNQTFDNLLFGIKLQRRPVYIVIRYNA